MQTDADIFAVLKGVTTATLTTVLLKKGTPQRLDARRQAAAAGPAAHRRPRFHAALHSGAGGISRPLLPGPRPSRRGRRSRRCRRAASRWSTRWASRTPASSATSSARGCSSAAWRSWSPTGLCATWRRARNRPLGLVPGRCRPGLGRGPHLRQLAGADRLRRRRRFPDDIVVVDDDGAVLIPAALVEDVWPSRRSRSAWRPGSCRRSARAFPSLASIR